MPRPLTAAYTASKHALTGLTKSILLDGRAFGITASQIDVGNAATDMSGYMETGALQADGERRVEPRMDVARVAEMVLHIAGLPDGANVPFVTVMASGMPFYGRG
jgi:NAD(P)-dependent dehydrogenase (short-subunit alcohol dehydrogenase family)